ncbi:MAG: energy transducer TonB [Paludibacter sp.]|jgi:TonB family protein|nr:energy transducer TonB [Paludibacter sp.]
MATKIKFNIFKFLFRLFSFLSDKTGGWMLFVKPKLLLGTLIVGLGVTACAPKEKKAENAPNQNSTTESALSDSIFNNNTDSVKVNVQTTEFSEPLVSCYVYEELPKEITANVEDSFLTSCYITLLTSDIIDNNEINPEKDICKVYEIVEQMPQFPGGEDALLDFLSENIHYPLSSIEFQGRVTCRFVVEKDGSISRIEVLRKLEKECDEEAVRVIKSMPKWTPGKQNGEIVAVWYTIPITFRLPK